MKRAMTTTTLMCALALFAVTGCDKKEEATNANTTTNAATATATPAPEPTAQTTVTIADSDLVTPADFEETAEKSITPKNYKQELATIEADLNKE